MTEPLERLVETEMSRALKELAGARAEVIAAGVVTTKNNRRTAMTEARKRKINEANDRYNKAMAVVRRLEQERERNAQA